MTFHVFWGVCCWCGLGHTVGNVETKWRLVPNTWIASADFCKLEAFPALQEKIWQRCACQHKDFTQNMLNLISGLQALLGHAHLLFLYQGPFYSFCVPWESQISSSLTEVVPSVCLQEHFAECLLSFSPQEPLPLHLLPLWCPHSPIWVLWHHDSPFLVLIPWLKTGNCSGFGSGGEMPWQQLALSWGFLPQGIVVADSVWESDSHLLLLHLVFLVFTCSSRFSVRQLWAGTLSVARVKWLRIWTKPESIFGRR